MAGMILLLGFLEGENKGEVFDSIKGTKRKGKIARRALVCCVSA